ncbi:MAG: hypothetical protein SGJ18_09590 [Pseudomonadota bacterium]|nr:hypothetical protein [Pseudomonadota bacterium]
MNAGVGLGPTRESGRTHDNLAPPTAGTFVRDWREVRAEDRNKTHDEVSGKE